MILMLFMACGLLFFAWALGKVQASRVIGKGVNPQPKRPGGGYR